ncbi:hypothetical protein [Maritalea sp.]|uniref:hypothetical protein n=1 Tax=Maritalea sp. TaxID=2003361 RepID=UPI003EF66A69
MLRTTNLIACFLFLLGETMLFAANRYDPINASILMLAMLLLALSSVRFLFAPFAPSSNRVGASLLVFGFFSSAFFFFDIMGFGLTPHSSHFDRTLFWGPLLFLMSGAVLFAVWLYPLGKIDKALGLTLPLALLIYAAPRLLALSPSAQLVTAFTLCATLVWLALYKIRQF